MPDPFTLSSIILSYAIHIGHIGYTIYQTKTSVEKKVVDIIETKKDIQDQVQDQVQVQVQDIQKDNEFQNTVNNIKSQKIPSLCVDYDDAYSDYADDETNILTCKNVKTSLCKKCKYVKNVNM